MVDPSNHMASICHMAKASIAATAHPIGIALIAGCLKAIIKIRTSNIGQDAITAPIPNPDKPEPKN